MATETTPGALGSNEGLGAWMPTADTARLPALDAPVWLYEGGIAYIGCRTDGGEGWLWAKCYFMPYLSQSGTWTLVDADIDDDYQPTLWQPLPEPPRYTQAELDAAKTEAAALVASIRVE